MTSHPLSDQPGETPIQLHQHPSQSRTLREAVDQAMSLYFSHLDGENVTDLYNMVMAEVEAPLLRSVMTHTRGNQTQASQMLGLNRGTLRKKLKQYDLI
ncbi:MULTISPECIES: DNA-binding transcriptional regulator Fis [Kushneria]|uniref:Putative Fis-like DNA-binding protein n=2 Tax=Kushneria TaxID=504090 RepID=A0A240UL71_9GAMM|nr:MULTISPECIES: DNA-binding transcriptional regulator Fis [Kushneria]ARS53775.1 Fis family transcriptional regulator [Kushneria konosiri]ART61876.1 Fis family transcriptional regulator [Kushneria marisflavi]RKD86918.1 DNA-binding protein Fis [Kushneria marisflavi]